MSISVACLTCGTKLIAPDASAGKWIKCTRCLAFIALPKLIVDAEAVEYDEPPPPVKASPIPTPQPEKRKQNKDDGRPIRKFNKRRKSQPQGTFPILPLLLLFVLVCMIIAGLFLSWRLGPSDKPIAKGASPDGPLPEILRPLAPFDSMGGWETVEKPEYSVRFPTAGTPRFEKSAGDFLPGAWVSHAEGVYKSMGKNKGFNTVCSTFSPGTMREYPNNPEALLERIVGMFPKDGTYRNMSGKMPVTSGVHRGVEFDNELTDGSGSRHFQKVRVFVAGNKMFQLIALDMDSPGERVQRQTFFESFRVK
jgi:hypothetical protein